MSGAIGTIGGRALEAKTRAEMERQKKAAGPSGKPPKSQITQRQADAQTRSRLKAGKLKAKSKSKVIPVKPKARKIIVKRNAKGEYSFTE